MIVMGSNSFALQSVPCFHRLEDRLAICKYLVTGEVLAVPTCHGRAFLDGTYGSVDGWDSKENASETDLIGSVTQFANNKEQPDTNKNRDAYCLFDVLEFDKVRDDVVTLFDQRALATRLV